MAKINEIKTYTVGVSNLDDEAREYNITANAHVDNGVMTMLDCGEIHRLPVEGGVPEGEYVGSFNTYEGGGSVSVNGNFPLTEAAELVEAFADEVRADIEAKNSNTAQA